MIAWQRVQGIGAHRVFQSIHPHPRSQVALSIFKVLRNKLRLSPLRNVHAIAKSHAGSPTPSWQKSMTALNLPFSTSKLPTAILP